MFVKSLAVLTLASMVGLGASFSAHANSRFTVENNTDKTVDVVVFNGGDTYCGTPAKSKKVDAGKSGSFGCLGNGKGKCKISLGIDGEQICKSDRNTCSKSAIKMDGGSTVTVSRNSKGKPVCAYD